MAKPGMTFAQLLRLGMRFKSKLLGPVRVIGLDKSDWRTTGRTVTIETGKPPRRYNQVVRPFDRLYEGPLSGKAGRVKLVCLCNCPDFQYRWRWVLSELGAAPPGPVDEPPDITNPSRQPGICKHLLAVFLEISRRKL